ncbi:ATG26, partial [Symbiodinium pilosum]
MAVFVSALNQRPLNCNLRLGESLLNGELAEEGWHDLAQFARQSVFFIAEVPHAWLLPHCSCLVHHGGAGTLQTALREGVPSVVTPIFADQFDNSRAVARLSAGVGFEENLSQVSAFELAEAIHEAEACRPEVRSLGEQLRDNNGAQQ